MVRQSCISNRLLIFGTLMVIYKGPGLSWLHRKLLVRFAKILVGVAKNSIGCVGLAAQVLDARGGSSY